MKCKSKAFGFTNEAHILCLPLQDDRLNAKDLMNLFNSGSSRQCFHELPENDAKLQITSQLILVTHYPYWPLDGSKVVIWRLEDWRSRGHQSRLRLLAAVR